MSELICHRHFADIQPDTSKQNRVYATVAANFDMDFMIKLFFVRHKLGKMTPASAVLPSAKLISGAINKQQTNTLFLGLNGSAKLIAH